MSRYASEHFTEKWGYAETSKRFQATLAILTNKEGDNE